jgi:hypothetical protein
MLQLDQLQFGLNQLSAFQSGGQEAIEFTCLGLHSSDMQFQKISLNEFTPHCGFILPVLNGKPVEDNCDV